MLSQLKSHSRYSSVIVAFAAAWLAGLWLGHSGWMVPLWGLVGAALALVASWRTKWLIVATLILGLAAGIFYGYQSQTRYQVIDNLIGHKATFAGVITDDPSTADTGTTTFTLESLRLNDRSVPGALTIKTYSSKYQRGYQVQVVGKLYEVLGSKQAGMYATITTISTRQSWLEQLRQRFIAGINSNLPDPLNGFALGLLIGARSLIPKTLQDQLTVVGLSHLVAVSGYNLTIMIQAAARILKRTSRYIALAVSLWLMLGFVVVAGSSASIVRAALVTGLGVIAHYYGRQIKPWVLVAIPAFATTLWRPDYLWNDVGWQLSFLAFIGILVVAPLLENWLRRPNWLKKLIIEASAAQLMTFPIILAVFHQFSVVGLLANTIVLPMVPLAMLASFGAGIAGTWLPAVGILSLPAYAILKLTLELIREFASLPWASLNLAAPTSLIIVMYAALGLVIASLSRRATSIVPRSDLNQPTDEPAGELALDRLL